MRPRHEHLASVFCVAFMSSGLARAQDSDELAGILDESVVTTASQSAETASTAPATSTLINADELRRYGVHTLEEAINFLSLGVSSAGGVGPSSSPDLGARGVFLAGDAGGHFLLLIDGHAVNEPYFGAGRFDRNAGIPLEAVDHIEVIVGPGSVLYGSNAMLGVIHVITKSGSSAEGASVTAESELGTWRRAAATVGARFDLLGEKAELSSALQYWDEYGPDYQLGPQNIGMDIVTQRPARTRRGGPEDGIWAGTASRSVFAHVPSALLRFRVGNFELGLRGRIAKWGEPFTVGDFDSPDSYTVERNASVDLKHHALLSSELELTTRLYADTYDSREHAAFSRASSCPYTGVTTCEYVSNVASRWAGVELQAKYNWLRDGTLSTLLGFDGRTRFAGAKLDSLDADSGRTLESSYNRINHSDRTFGAYLQQTWTPGTAFGLNAGARLDRDPRFAAVVSPRAAASFGVWPGGTLRVIYSEAFRAPTFEQSDASNFVLARAQPLDPERVRSVEASIEQRMGTHRVFFGAFRSTWKNLVELRYLTYEEAVRAVEEGRLRVALPYVSHTEFQNVATIESIGFNAAVEGAWLDQKLRYGVNVTEAHSRRDDPELGEQPLPVAPRFYGNARLSYDFGGALPTAAIAAYTFSSRLADRALTSGFRPLPVAPTQLDLRATLSGPVPFAPGLSYRLSADYVTASRGPYAIGPVLAASAANPSAELDPLPRFRATIGLQYDFGTR